MGEEVVREMRAISEPLIDRLHYGYARSAPSYAPGPGRYESYWGPRESYGAPRDPYARARRFGPSRDWETHRGFDSRDWHLSFIDQATRLAEETVRGAADLAARLADLMGPSPLNPRSFGGPPPGSYPSSRSWAPPAPASATGALTLPPVRPGGTTTGDIELENTSNQYVDNLRLTCVALLGSKGERIAGLHLTATPGALDLGPWARARVKLTLNVPIDTQPTRYVGLVEAEEAPGVQCLVTVSVD